MVKKYKLHNEVEKVDLSTFETSQYTVFVCRKCSSCTAFDKIKHAKVISRIKIKGHFECVSCDKKELRREYGSE